MAKLLSPLQLQAAAGLDQNQGMQVPEALSNSIINYSSSLNNDDTLPSWWPPPVLSGLSNLQSALSQCIANNIANATIANLMTIASNTCPALADSIPEDFIVAVVDTSTPIVTNFPTGNLSPNNPGLSGTVEYIANLELGEGDFSKFAQVLSTAQGYVTTTNTFINSANNANTYLGGTFTTMDQLVTGDLTLVNINTQAFGNDLTRLGQTINLANLDNLGTPFALIQQVVRLAGLVTPLIVAFGRVGINENIVLSINDPALLVTDSVQKQMYQAMTLITGNDLDQIKQVLGVTTANINTMADLLNPLKMFPTSYATITVPTCDGLKPIYVTGPGFVPPPPQSSADPCAPVASGETSIPNPDVSVNSTLITELPYTAPGINYLRLSKITPDDIALANRALAVSLGQLTNISRMSLAQLSAAYIGIETNRGLDLINAQTQPVIPAALDYYASTLASGSGPNGTLLLTDVIGTVIGTVHIEAFANAANLIGQLWQVSNAEISNALSNLANIYIDLDGNITTGNETVIETLIVDAQSNIATILADTANTANIITELNSSFNAIGDQLKNENQNQIDATLSLTELSGNSRTSTQTLILALPSYGLDTTEGGPAYVVEQLAQVNFSTVHVVGNSVSYTYGLPLDYRSPDETPVTSITVASTTPLDLTESQYTITGNLVTIDSGSVSLAANDVITISCASIYGQSIVATLREGRTKAALNVAGISTANEVESDPSTPPPQANLSPSTYTA